MKLPLIVLGVMALIAGLLPFSHYVTSDGTPLQAEMHITFSIAPVLLALTGILFATRMYKNENDLPAKVAARFGDLFTSAKNKFYIDELYLLITKGIIFNLIGKPAAWIDRNIVDGGVNLSADLTDDTSGLIKGWQSGKMQQYAIWFFVGVLSLLLLFVLVNF